MEFRFKPNLTKDFIFSKISEEDIFANYLGINVKSKKLYCSPFRIDNHPTCGLYRNKLGTVILHDFATGDSYNSIQVVMTLFNLSYHKAIKQIAIDFNLIKSTASKKLEKVEKTLVKVESKRPCKIQITQQEFTEEELLWWSNYNITSKILKKFQVYSCKNLFLNDNYYAVSSTNNMIFGYYGNKKDNFELWRCYFPLRKENRFITNWPATKIQGYKQLPKEGNILVITKSMKDCMCFYSFKIPAIAPNSEHLFISDTVLEDLKKRFKYIFVMYDNDITGLSNMRKLRDLHPELIYLWIPLKYKCKDFSDLVKMYGEKKVKKLIKKWIVQIQVKHK